MKSTGINALVIGGAGFIGSELVHQLAAAGTGMTVVDNLATGKRENLAGLPAEKVRFIEGDLRDGELMAPLMKQAQVVYHLACLGVRQSIHSPFENHQVNAEGTLRLLMLARAAHVERFVYVSSSEVYGTGLRVPMDEDHPTYPMTVYGAAKLAGEAYTRAFYRTYGMPTVVIRPFNTYGPRCHHEGDSGEVIPRFMLRAMAGRRLVIFGDGEQTRDFTCVSDTARGILLAGVIEGVEGETINLGYGREITINQLAEEVAAVTGRKVQVKHDIARPGDTLRLYADTGKARRLLGFEAQVSLRQGLEKLRDWYTSLGKPPGQLLEEEVVHNWEGSGL